MLWWFIRLNPSIGEILELFYFLHGKWKSRIQYSSEAAPKGTVTACCNYKCWDDSVLYCNYSIFFKNLKLYFKNKSILRHVVFVQFCKNNFPQVHLWKTEARLPGPHPKISAVFAHMWMSPVNSEMARVALSNPRLASVYLPFANVLMRFLGKTMQI